MEAVTIDKIVDQLRAHSRRYPSTILNTSFDNFNRNLALLVDGNRALALNNFYAFIQQQIEIETRVNNGENMRSVVSDIQRRRLKEINQ